MCYIIYDISYTRLNIWYIIYYREYIVYPVVMFFMSFLTVRSFSQICIFQQVNFVTLFPVSLATSRCPPPQLENGPQT